MEILILEDDPVCCDLYRRHLAGPVFALVSTAGEAVHLLSKHQPKIVILNYVGGHGPLLAGWITEHAERVQGAILVVTVGEHVPAIRMGITLRRNATGAEVWMAPLLWRNAAVLENMKAHIYRSRT